MTSIFDRLPDIAWQDLEKELDRHPPTEENIQKILDFLTLCIEKGVYEKEKMALVLPFIHDRIVYSTTDWASRLLYEAITHNDDDFIQNLLGYPQVSTHVDGSPKDRIEGWCSYLEHHIYGQYEDTKSCPLVAKRLAQYFGDKDGMGLLRCVQKNDERCFDALLPFSNLKTENYFVYYAALSSSNSYFVEKLEPLCNKVETLLGLKNQFPYPVSNEKDHIDQVIVFLEEKIKSSPKTCAEKLYNLLTLMEGDLFSSLLQKSHQDLSDGEMHLLLHTCLSLKQESLAKSLIELMEDVPCNLLIKTAPFKDALSLALPKTSKESRQNLLWVLCRDESKMMFENSDHHLCTVFKILDTDVAADDLLNQMERVAHSSLLPQRKPQRLKDVETFKNFCSLHTKYLIESEITPTEKTSPSKKM